MDEHQRGRGADRMLQLLRALADDRGSSAAELAAHTGTPLSTTYRLLAAATEHGFAMKSPAGGYSPGPQAVRFAQRYRDVAIVQPAIATGLERLAARSGELSAFMIAFGDEALCVAAAQGRGTLRCAFSPGAAQPLRAGATALALLSRVPEPQRSRLLDEASAGPSPCPPTVEELERVRARGYAESVGVLDPDVWGVSAPVVDGRDALVGTVTVMVPSSRVGARRPHLVNLTLETARTLSGGIR